MQVRKSVLVWIMVVATMGAGHAWKIDGKAPRLEFKGMSGNNNFAGLKADIETRMNDEVGRAFNNTLDTARKNLAGFTSQKQLAQGMANANAYSSNSATLQGNQNYDLFAVSSGFMLAVQAPSLSPSYYKSIGDEISNNGDLYAGLGVGFSYFNFGLNCKFFMPGLYLNAKYGGLSQKVSDFSVDFKVMGVGASYSIMDTKSFIGLVKWRGISASTGFYMQMDELKQRVKPKSIKTPADIRKAVMSGSTPGTDSTNKEALLVEMGYGPNDSDATVTLKPAFDMGLDISTYTVPLEVNTAVSVLWGLLSINAGVGMDLNFGNAKIVLKGGSTAAISSDTTKVVFHDASMVVDGSSENGPSFVRMRAMTGIGTGIGPVRLEIPIVYYVKSGLAFGVTAAIVW